MAYTMRGIVARFRAVMRPSTAWSFEENQWRSVSTACIRSLFRSLEPGLWRANVYGCMEAQVPPLRYL
jgi:hypothetical protein